MDAPWISGSEFDYGDVDAGYYADHRGHMLSTGFELASAPGAAELCIAVLGFVGCTGSPIGFVVAFIVTWLFGFTEAQLDGKERPDALGYFSPSSQTIELSTKAQLARSPRLFPPA